jgi:death-on-curing family protein
VFYGGALLNPQRTCLPNSGEEILHACFLSRYLSILFQEITHPSLDIETLTLRAHLRYGRAIYETVYRPNTHTSNQRPAKTMATNGVKFRFLSAIQVQRLHGLFIGNTQLSQPSLLESAVQSPINIKYYNNQQNLFQLAASLSEKIMKNHAYHDGNKRTALLAADMFLKINGYELQKMPMQPNLTLENAQVAVCTDKWTAEELGRFYEQIAAAIGVYTPPP